MRMIPDAWELRFHRLLADLRGRLGSSRSVERTLRSARRTTAEFFEAEAACVATLTPGAPQVELDFAFPPDAAWDTELLTRALQRKKAEIPDNLLVATIQRRGRAWGLLALQRERDFERWQLQVIHKVAACLAELVVHIDREHIAEVRARVDHKIMDRLRPKDLSYQILDSLRLLTRYDHSAALFVADGSLRLVAEQIAWRKDRSWRIGEELAVTPDIKALLEAGHVHGFDRDGETWHDWTGHDGAALATLLDYNAAPVPPDFEREEAMLCVPLVTRDGVLGALKIAGRHAGALGPYEADLVSRFRPQVSVAMQRQLFAASAETLHAKVLQAEKENAMADLARGVAHDVNNSLGGVLLSAQQLQAELEDGCTDVAVLTPIIDRVENGVKACVRIFGGMLDFARGAARARGPVSVQRALDDALALQDGHITRARVRREVAVPDDLPAITGRQTDLQQVFLNLITNAVDSMEDGGVLTIQAERRDGRIRVRIADTGCGIEQNDLGRIHDAFVTTKDKGSGLGLPICRSLLSEMNGELEIESEKGKGTSACVLLPVTA